MATKKNEYSPLMFLAALWSGWLSVSFFMYLMFMTEHKWFPIPTFNTLIEYFYYYNDLSLWTWFSVLITLSLLWVVFFAFKHFTSLIFNIKWYLKFRKTKKFEKIKQSNDEVILMTIPLTFAMSINVLFMLWALFVPWLWNYVEYLFSFAIIWFMIIWYFAIKIFLDYFTRLLTVKSFDFVWNNTLWQMLSVFAFTMVWVWFAAPAAMSTNTTTIAISLVFSIFFITIAIFFSILKIILWFKSILKEWIAKEASPTLWMLIPILTLIWISFVRQQHWLHEWFNLHLESWTLFTLTTSIISLQIIFWVIWYKVMKMNNYFKDYLNWDKKSPWSFALICPWVALVVFWFFFLHLGFVKNDIINQFSIIYIILLLPLIFLQYKTINTLLKLENKFFKQK